MDKNIIVAILVIACIYMIWDITTHQCSSGCRHVTQMRQKAGGCSRGGGSTKPTTQKKKLNPEKDVETVQSMGDDLLNKLRTADNDVDPLTLDQFIFLKSYETDAMRLDRNIRTANIDGPYMQGMVVPYEKFSSEAFKIYKERLKQNATKHIGVDLDDLQIERDMEAAQQSQIVEHLDWKGEKLASKLKNKFKGLTHI